MLLQCNQSGLYIWYLLIVFVDWVGLIRAYGIV